MHIGLEEAERGFERMAAFYAERARGGVGLMVTGGIAPSEQACSFPGGAKMTTEAEAEQHREITSAVHAAGGRIAMQILHFGRYAHHPDLVAPSAIRPRSAGSSRTRSPTSRSRRPSRSSSGRRSWRGSPGTTASRSWAPRAI